MFGAATQNGVGVGIGNIPTLTSLSYSVQLNLAVAALFASGEPGIWLDNADWNTGWFQDAAGTIPITAMEQPLGLALSKDKGLAVGAEIVTNGSNPTATTGWTPSAGSTLTVVGNKFRVQGQESYQAFTTVVGKWYRVSIDIAVVNPGAVYVGTAPRNAANYSTGQVSVSATKTFYFLATVASTYISMLPWNGGTEYCDFNNISCKQIAGNHVFQSTSGVRPVVSARVNLLTGTEDKANAAWAKTNVTAPTATTVKASAGTFQAFCVQGSLAVSASQQCTMVTNAKNGTYDYLWMGDRGDAVIHSATFNVNTGAVIGSSNCTPTITANADGTWLCKIAYTRTNAGSASQNEAFGGSSHTIDYPSRTWAGTETLTATKDDFRPTDQTVTLPPYQRVNTSSDYDGPDKGFPPYISLNGTQWMQTGSVDYSGVNKMLVIAGVRKLSDATTGIIIELSANFASNNGSFAVFGPSSNGVNDLYFGSKGTIAASAIDVLGKAAPLSTVMTCQSDIGAPSISMRLNGALAQSNSSTQGTGNYGNFAHYIGSRAGSSLFFTGQISQLIARGSTVAANDGQIGSGEAYSRMRSRAY